MKKLGLELGDWMIRLLPFSVPFGTSMIWLYVLSVWLDNFLLLWHTFDCAHEICVPAAGVPPGGTRKRENAKTPSTEMGKNENAKTRKRRKRENGENTIHSVVLWTRTLSQIWACVGMYASNPFRILRTQTLSQLWACVKYAPKQPSP